MSCSPFIFELNLLFIRRLDEIQLTKEKQAHLVGIAIKDPVYSDDNVSPESDYTFAF